MEANKIVIKDNFIRGEDGVWYNLDHVSLMKVGRNKTSRFISIHIANFTYNLCVDTCTEEEMQERLDGVLKLLKEDEST